MNDITCLEITSNMLNDVSLRLPTPYESCSLAIFALLFCSKVTPSLDLGGYKELNLVILRECRAPKKELSDVCDYTRSKFLFPLDPCKFKQNMLRTHQFWKAKVSQSYWAVHVVICTVLQMGLTNYSLLFVGRVETHIRWKILLDHYSSSDCHSIPPCVLFRTIIPCDA